MRQKMLLLLAWTILYSSGISFHLYETDRLYETSLDQIQYDCIYYNTRNFVPSREQFSERNIYQMIAYCIRPLLATEDSKSEIISNSGHVVMFSDLRDLNITSQQFYNQWSVPVDVAERYELFLQNLSISDPYFVNCSPSYFGDRCQYELTYIESINKTFADIAESIFLSRYEFSSAQLNDKLLITNLTCYTHLDCDRGPQPSCLDWREVCDGKVDCMNNGIDESECFKIESYDCADYRCRIGHCIPNEFVHDDIFNPDCLDGTDEPSRPDYTTECMFDPTFRCEERKPRRPLEFTCGDGFTIDLDKYNRYFDNCRNNRFSLLIRALLSEHPADMSDSCWLALLCFHPLAKLSTYPKLKDICENISNTNPDFQMICPKIFFYPVEPVMLGHIRFAYKSSSYQSLGYNYEPDFVCFDETLCNGFVEANYNISGRTCVSGNRFNTNNWDKTAGLIYDTFKRCLSHSSIQRRNITHCDDDSLYACEDSLKCISKYRLQDGFVDCPHGDDELNIDISCSLPDAKYRYRCEIPSNQCIARVQIRDSVEDCESREDEIDPVVALFPKQPFFSKLCNGVKDIRPILIFNESYSDETHCEHWPCDNIYTRCDQFWTCKNGTDESRCTNSLCGFDTHPCLSPFNNQLTCLPIEKANDGQVDCRGATDERFFCRENKHLSSSVSFYRCWNATTCIDPHFLCSLYDGKPKCEFADDYQFCSEINDTNFGFCSLHLKKNEEITVAQRVLCGLVAPHEEIEEVKNIYLSLDQSNNYPVTLSYNENVNTTPTKTGSLNHNASLVPFERAWICNRGIPLQMNNETRCLCPPSFYGSRCERQNQRVSLTVQFRKQVGFAWNALFTISTTLIDTNEHQIESYDQILYIPSRDCSVKYNFNLLYSKRPKEKSQNYSIRIDAYDKYELTDHISWHIDIPLLFLPVNRISTLLEMPARKSVIHSTNEYSLSHMTCDCAAGSRCVGKTTTNRSICICPLEKFGRRCFLTRSSCGRKPCQHGGICVPTDDRILETNLTCLCPDNYFGKFCEYFKRKIDITFTNGLMIPPAIIAHFITVPNKLVPPVHTTQFKRSKINEDSIVLLVDFIYHMLFVEIDRKYYLAALQQQGISSNSVQTAIDPSRRCPHIRELLNSTLLAHPMLRRVKYYHSVCQSQLVCFYDEVYLCLCTIDRHANCFHFDHHNTAVCRSADKYCEHDEAQCFEDHTICPNSLLCVCPECTYGAKCQFSTTRFGFSLDAIIGYHIQPHVPLTQQTSVVQVSIALTMNIFILGSINGVLCILTFKSRVIQQFGSGVYLLSTSIVSILIILTFLLKFWLLLLSQMAFFINRSFLLFHCYTIDFFVKTLLNTGDWLHACIAVERAVTVAKGVNFNKIKSKRAARWVVGFVLLMTVATNIHDPVYRRLVDDGEEEQRLWCIVSYPKNFERLTLIMNIFHFFAPFAINLFSALFILNQLARQRSAIRKNQTYWRQFKKEFMESKSLLISPVILVILALPRLIITFTSGCMKSARDPWIFLTGYFVSFVPSLTTFVVFVIPSSVYKKEFNDLVLQPFITFIRQTRGH